MLIKDARVENKNGFRFYEKDILKDDYMFSSDIEIIVKLDYITPGFGVVLMDSGGDSANDKNNIYLFKIGYKEASIYHSSKTFQKLEKQISSHKIKTITEGLELRVKKIGKKVIMYVDGEKVYEYFIKNELPRYNIGYYSSKENIIKEIIIRSATPNKWSVNMENTIGGYVRFLEDAVSISDCRQDAEIEQQNIFLKGGTHYLNYVLEDMNGINDLKVFIHRSDDDRIYNEEKNILKDGRIKLVEDMLVNIKIVGRNGDIKNISLSEIPDDDYISTTDNIIDFDGSYLDAYLNSLKKITWKGCVNKVPNFFLDNSIEEYGTILDNKNTIKPEDTGIVFGSSDRYIYDYEFNCETYLFKISKDDKTVFMRTLTNIVNKITIFKNLSAKISELILYKTNGEIINVNIQNENKQYINADISSPILVVDKYDYPLDISSSYRKSVNEDGNRYIFTNWEREIFESSRLISLEKSMSKDDDSMIIYGIRKGFDININKIYDIKEDNINAIDMFTKHYDRLNKNIVLYYNPSTREMILDQSVEDEYSYIVIDYRKMNSYCINYHYDKHSYEVNVSTDEKKFKILYNSKELDKENNIYQINEYKNTEINGNVAGYIVLRKGV